MPAWIAHPKSQILAIPYITKQAYLMHYNVLGFDISMEYTFSVQEIHAIADLKKQLPSTILWQPLFLLQYLL